MKNKNEETDWKTERKKKKSHIIRAQNILYKAINYNLNNKNNNNEIKVKKILKNKIILHIKKKKTVSLCRVRRFCASSLPQSTYTQNKWNTGKNLLVEASASQKEGKQHII